LGTGARRRPAEDLAWFCIRAWRFGAPKALDAGGLGSIEDFLAAYEATGGAHVDPDEFRWWLALATLRWRHLPVPGRTAPVGQTPSVERPHRRRVCEANEIC
jgi:aminoglycoside phosphotransferase (APT) family kinase protein